MAKRRESLADIVERLGRVAARAEADAAADNTVDPWDLIDLDASVAAAAWKKLQRGARMQP